MANRPRNILLLGSNERAGLELCRSLGRAGHRVTILRHSPQRTPADHSRYCAASVHIGSPEFGVRAYVARLLDYLRSHDFDYFVPVDNLSFELAYPNYDAISSVTTIVGPSSASFHRARNGYEILAIADSAGLSRPNTILARAGETLATPEFPCVAKPVLSYTIIDDELQRFSVRRIASVDELDAKLRDDLSRVDVMLQALMSGATIELNFCSFDGNVLGASITRDLGGSTSCSTSSYRTTEVVTPIALTIICNVARALAWTGFMTIVCKSEDGRLGVTRFNYRPSSSLSASNLAEVDFPTLLLDAFEGRGRSSVALPTKAACTRHLRIDLASRAAQVVRGGGRKAIGQLVRAFTGAIFGPERLEVERVYDPLPAVRQFDRQIRALGNKLAMYLSSALQLALTSRPEAGSVGAATALLVVCQGNINRSVVAEHLLRAQGFANVRSAGLLPMSGRRPSKPAEEFLTKRHKIDLTSFRSQSVTRFRDQMEEIDVILCFERRHVAELQRRFPNIRGKVFLLSALATEHQRPAEIADPHGSTPESYLACFARIELLVNQVAMLARSADPLTNV